MHKEMMSPFVEGTLEMMGSMLGLDCQVIDVEATLDPAPTLFGTIKLNGQANGRITVSLQEADGRQLVGAMMGMEGDEVDEELMLDGLGEMANVIAGFARSVLATSHLEVEIGLPEVLTVAPEATEGGVTHKRIESDLGSFHLTLELLKAA